MPLRIANRLQSSPRLLALGALAVYRAAVSPILHALNHNRPACRFEPSCSEYARDAIAEHGFARGVAMAAWRVARCNPWGGHGYDPVESAPGRRARN
jgi:putative membrane protein insertion efficiency factor